MSQTEDTIDAIVQEHEEPKDEKPHIENKTSMEILSELFSTFDAEPPVIVKKEKAEEAKKHKKSKKKHKHKDRKDKKHKKKSKKKRRKSIDSSSSDSEGIDLSELIKTELTGTALLSDSLQKLIKTEIKQESQVPDESIDVSNVKVKEEGEIETKKDMLDDDVNKEKLKANTIKTKITIKEIKASSLIKVDKKGHKKKRHEKSDKYDDVPLKKRKTSKSQTRSRSVSRSRSRSREIHRKERKDEDKHHKYRSRSRSPRTKSNEYYDKYDKHKHDIGYRSDKYKNAGKYHDDRDSVDYRDHRAKDSFYKEKDDFKYDRDERHRNGSRRYEERDDDFYKSYDEDRRFKDRSKDYDRERERDRERDRDRERSREKETRFDKKKLLEIARKNAIQMMKSGKLSGALTLGPQAQEKVIAAISGGGKTIEELTDFCKTLSKKEELGELSSVSSVGESDSEEDDMTIRHPFQIKEKSFTINIKNSVPLPTRTNQERASELRIQFPVSSGQHHRKTESEWVPVSPKKTELPAKLPSSTTPTVNAPAITTITTPLAIEAAPTPQAPIVTPAGPIVANNQLQTLPVVPPGPQVFPPASKQTEHEIASIVSQRLAAMRKLQENPNDSQAIREMYNAQKGMNTWAESKLPFGQFTGTTGANILSQAQLASGYQAWARKDQLQTAAPVSGGMGMHLLQKMGWRPGEGLGKEKTGTLEPLLLEVKLDKKGVIAKEECKKKAVVKIPKQTVKTLEGKHPVSLLHEYASKRKLGAPEYVLDFECGPDHMKNFLFKVTLNGIEYKPNVASGNKKDAKAMAATVCLQSLGILPQ